MIMFPTRESNDGSEDFFVNLSFTTDLSDAEFGTSCMSVFAGLFLKVGATLSFSM